MNADVTPMNAEKDRERLDVLSRAVIGAAQRVSLALGVGFLEKVYENSLLFELQESGLVVAQQKPVHVRYGGKVVGDYVPDLLVSNEVLVEIKATPALDEIHRLQCINYLRATGLRVCLLINFGRPRLEVKRIVWRY
jgi:GxxExxY protein